MPDIDAFETAYGRLASTGLAAASPSDAPSADPDENRAPSVRRDTPRSRLLPRLALMAPRAKPRRAKNGPKRTA